MDLPIEIDKRSGIPLYVQMEQRIRLLVHQGVLKPGDLMPTVRAMAVALAVNYNTVARVYRDLEQAGVLVLRRGIGTFVAEETSARPLAPSDLDRLEKQVDELIGLGRRLKIGPVELSQLIETRWKEICHAHR